MHGAMEPTAMAATSLFSGLMIFTTTDSVSGGRGHRNWLARSAMLNSDDDTKYPPTTHLVVVPKTHEKATKKRGGKQKKKTIVG